MFLKIVTKWQEIQKSKLNNSLTNWVFEKQFSHSILSQCAFLALFICFAISWNFNFAVKLVMSFSRQKLLKPQNKKQDVLEYKVLPSYMYKVWAQMNKKCKSSSWVAAFMSPMGPPCYTMCLPWTTILFYKHVVFVQTIHCSKLNSSQRTIFIFDHATVTV